MKKGVFAAACAIVLFCAQAHAARSLDLTGNEYRVYFVCDEDLGDFCDRGDLEDDVFFFDEGHFGIESLGDDLGGLLSSGDYSSSGIGFEANYDSFKGLDRYEIDIEGFSLIDILLLGKMEIKYTENLIGDTSRGDAWFIAIKD